MLALTGFFGTLPSLIMLDTDAYELIDKALDLITVVVPPALPLALSIGINQSLRRLRKSAGIYCISPQKIIQAGLIDCIVFDKTGTLTEDKLILEQVIPFSINTISESVIGQNRCRPSNNNYYNPNHPFFRALSACQSLVIIDDIIYGDPLEIELLK